MRKSMRLAGAMLSTALVLVALASVGAPVASAAKCARDNPNNMSNWKDWGFFQCSEANAAGEGEWSLVEGSAIFVEGHLYCMRVVAGERSEWKNANCTEKELSTSGYNQVELRWWQFKGERTTAPVNVKNKGTVVLSDLGAKVKIECEGTGTGTVGAENNDVQKTLTATKCKTLEGTCPSPSAEAVGLPWETQVVEIGSAVRDEIGSKSGWKVTCAGIIKDTCEAEAEAPVVNVTKASAVVEEEFPASENENDATCSLTKEKKGDVSGHFTVEGESGEVSLG